LPVIVHACIMGPWMIVCDKGKDFQFCIPRLFLCTIDLRINIFKCLCLDIFNVFEYIGPTN
jgi:hypothetical protein